MKRNILDNTIFILISLGMLLYLFSINSAMNPDLECCDHLFYRAQAISWFDLNELNFLQIPENNRLNDVYDFYYYDRINTLTNQPPYVYRVIIPSIAGVMGKVLGINISFYIINAVSLFFILYLSMLITYKLTKSSIFSLLSPFVLFMIPEFFDFYIYDYMLVDLPAIALFFGIVTLIIINKLKFAFWVSALIAPLVKETLLPLSLVVVVFMIFKKVKWRPYIIFCLIPFFAQAMLRVLFQVKDEPQINEIYQFSSAFTSLISLFDSFGWILFLLLFSYSKKNQKLLISLIPQVIFILIITSSTVADGKRIWWTIAPVFILAYSNLVAIVKNLVKSYWPNMKLRFRTKV
jgi:hypothetical protein